MRKNFNDGSRVEFEKNEFVKDKVERTKSGVNFDQYLKFANLIVVLFFILDYFLNKEEIYFKDNFASLIVLFFVVQVIATSGRYIYKMFIGSDPSKAFFVLGLCTFIINPFLIKGGLALLDNNMVEYFTYKDEEKNIAIYIDTENNNKEVMFKEINLVMMKNLGALEGSGDIDINRIGTNDKSPVERVFSESEGINFKEIGKYFRSINKELMDKKFGKAYEIDNQTFEYNQGIRVKFSEDKSKIKEMVITGDIAAYGDFNMIGADIGEFMFGLTGAYPNHHFEKVGDSYHFRRNSPDGREFYFILNLIVDENDLIKEIHYGDFAVG